MPRVGRRRFITASAAVCSVPWHRIALAAEYKSPGIYVEELSSGARPIQAVGTSTSAIFGVAPHPKAPLRKAMFVTSYREYVRKFGAGKVVVNVLSNAVKGFFINGGRRCCIVNLGTSSPIVEKDLAAIDTIDDISLILAPGYSDGASTDALISNCEQRGDRFALLDTPRHSEPLTRLTRVVGKGDGLRPRSSQQGFAAVYTPWIEVADVAAPGSRLAQPPSGHIAGVYARVDSDRGDVHKAPAGTALLGALGLTRSFDNQDLDLLSAIGVNPLRQMPDGIMVWGARTLADPSSEFRYVPVRRLVTMIRESILRSTRWVVFEPNDEPLWASIRRDVGAFLSSLWRDGALAGATPDSAFFVKCDAETTTQANIDEGRVNMIVGMAPARPAEFLILKITQTADSAASKD